MPGKAARFTRKSGKLIGRVAIGAPALVFGVIIYGYLTLPDVRPLKFSNPPTTAFIELRAQEARAQGKSPRKVQQSRHPAPASASCFRYYRNSSS